jgi:hypothetical protein
MEETSVLRIKASKWSLVEFKAQATDVHAYAATVGLCAQENWPGLPFGTAPPLVGEPDV